MHVHMYELMHVPLGVFIRMGTISTSTVRTFQHPGCHECSIFVVLTTTQWLIDWQTDKSVLNFEAVQCLCFYIGLGNNEWDNMINIYVSAENKYDIIIILLVEKTRAIW